MYGKSENADDYQRVRRAVAGMAIDLRDGRRFGRHYHRRNQLLFAAAGVLRVGADAGTWIVPPMRAVWVPAGVRHTLQAVGRCEVRTLYISAGAARHLPAGNCAVVNVSPLLRELIVEATKIPLNYDESGRDGLVMRLLLRELRILPLQALHLPMPTDARALRVCRAIQSRPGETASLEEYAKKAYVSEKTLARIFVRETGMSFGRWRQQARILASLPLLAGREPVLNVALSLGYDSPSAFTAMFRRALGVTPTQYFSLEAGVASQGGS
jgi:AraC-like DNA-binding protein/quercetin dioxygenase-like cupin family protein